MSDIIGKALLDYFYGFYTEDIITETNLTEEDELPLPYLFRSYDEMPKIEQKALDLSNGRVLDVGCGSGIHALYLQEKGLDVTAIDTSEGAIKVCSLRGIKNVHQKALLNFKDNNFDTILLLMNGTGLFQSIDLVDKYLSYLKSLLNPKGQILIDSSDLRYLYPSESNGAIWVPQDRYYGELEFRMHYKGETSDLINWLYMDKKIFQAAAQAQNFNFEIIIDGDNFDYLARLTHA